MLEREYLPFEALLPPNWNELPGEVQERFLQSAVWPCQITRDGISLGPCIRGCPHYQAAEQSGRPWPEPDRPWGFSCPHCGRDTFPTGNYCQWCAEPLRVDAYERVQFHQAAAAVPSATGNGERNEPA